ncbi:MutS family DNA mismatch repair protein [Clostridium peptidivorans]|uniref:MutS family DNA mismatch repair protein n=1 Tax=Clostridium peptidivorans TaxID=100174 RepID=UPI000BE30E8D|nr:MutS family DNA mismatch repair protein [Clostridium peptidivorans]
MAAYEKRKARYEKLLIKQRQLVNFISSLRIIVFVAGIFFTMYLYYKLRSEYISTIVFLVSGIAFGILIYWHDKVITYKNTLENIYILNDKGTKRISDKWREFEDKGEEFINTEHPYTYDLDIFGKSSLFQKINETNTFLGRKRLAAVLSGLNFSTKELYERQEAIKELSKKIGFRERFISESMINKGTYKDPEELFKWGKEKMPIYENMAIFIGTRIISIVSVVLIIIFFMGIVPYRMPLTALLIEGLLLLPGRDKRGEALGTVYRYKKNIRNYYNLIALLEKQNFKSPYLKELKEKLKENNSTATKAIDEFYKISSLTGDRANMVYMPINIIFLLDYYIIFRLERWKSNSGEKLQDWFEAIAELEALMSLALLCYENETWTMPEFKEEGLLFEGENIAHPLLSNNRISNDVKINDKNKILLITGSNMSGKSTFLRTVGINTVLAYTGAPICGERLIVSPMKIYTCMRISDNLEKNISSFYGELLRINIIVKAVEQKEPILFLLDEIFKGTNSLDRHTGAKILINKMSKENAIGLVSTHDLELGDLEKSNRVVKNYNFREYYSEGKIHFDYKLREGISKTRNAMYLMKLAGIDAEESDL